MALILETGSGLRVANSYISIAFVTSYLTNLGRETENSWDTATDPQKEAAAIAGSQYVDTRWGAQFKGTKQTRYDGSSAQALLLMVLIPVADEITIIGTQAYKWVAALTSLSNNEIVIGADVDACATNLIAAIVGSDDRGTLFSNALPANDSVGAELEEGTTDSILLTARQIGASGNDIPIDVTGTPNLTLTVAFQNGLEADDQALEFPRTGLWSPDGTQIIGIPSKLKQSCAEYAIRSHAASLYQDPVIDETSRAVTGKREKVGPIETETSYEEGSSAHSQLIKPYPAADRLLKDYVIPGGRAFR